MALFERWCEVSPVGDLLVRGACLHPDRDAVVFPTARRTYRQLLDGAIHVARGLIALGVKPGEHVGLLTTNSPEFVEALFGTFLAGCVLVPLNARHKANEIGYITANAELVALLTTADPEEYTDFSEIIRSALPSLSSASDPAALNLPEAPRLRCAILLRGRGRHGFLERAEFDRHARDATAEAVDALRTRVSLRDSAVIIYTSGTTANPKGCLLSHEAMTRGPLERARTRFGKGDHDITWGGGPLFHIGSLAPFIGSIGSAGTYLTDAYFEPGRALELMMRERVTVAWPWFSGIILPLIDHPSFDAARMATLRTMLLIVPPTLADRIQALLPNAEIVQGCGMTETAGIFAISDRDESPLDRSTTQGKAVPGVDIRILKIDGSGDADVDEVGEILVRGYCVMNGYYRDSQKTAEALDAHGWLHTGDLYHRSANGSLTFHGRLKDMLKVGGENVAAIEVEAFLCEHPAVRLAEVVGMPDARLDEVPVAFVELRPGASLRAEELIDFCKGRIANYKIPRAVHFLETADWPMSATKVNKRVLRHWLVTGDRKLPAGQG